MPKSILVTGGAGFIGSAYIRGLLKQTDTVVIALDKLTYAGNLANLEEAADSQQFHFVEGDINDGALVRNLLEKHACQAVLNFAAETHVDRSIGSPADFVMTNVNGTFQLLEASLDYWKTLPEEEKEAFRFLHVSTDEVYGSLGKEGLFTEETPYDPSSPYSASKASSDHFVRAYYRTYGLPTLITNCSNNYGPFQFPEKLIPLMVRKALLGEPLPVYGSGENVRDWLFVDDHCEALNVVLESGRVGETYNIGGGAERSNLQVVQTICEQVEQACPGLSHSPCVDLIEFVEDRPGHDFRYAIDCSKLRDELGWSPRVSFEEGIRQTVAWYLSHGQWVEAALDDASYGCSRLGLEREGVAETEQIDEVIEEIEGVEFTPLTRYHDSRGWLMELFRVDELSAENRPEMSYQSETLPGVTRGPHEHVEQSDYFAFIGPGDLCLYLWDAREDSPTHGVETRCVVGESNPVAVIVPPGVVHAYKNIDSKPAQVFNAPNRLYAGEGKQSEVDEIRHEDREDSLYSVS